MNDPDKDKTVVYEPECNELSQVDVSPPSQIGRYRIEKLLGKGGFGLVYLASDDQLSRPVAIKVPHHKLISKPEDAEAYLTEARTVANLDHPHIVPVFDVGATKDFPVFVVSKYVEGIDLATRLKQSRLTLHESVELVATVADALHYAHKQGLVHRDIKPGNILLDKSGKAFVVDFGLALREQDAGKGPRYAGTPAYMSPEQARGEGHRVDGRSDIFSLGVVFYELLTGRRPFKADSQVELLEQITSVEARPPRQVDDAIPKELERICLKSLSKRASERYTTAKDFAEDLRHFLVEQPVAGISSPTATPIVQPSSTSGGSGKSAAPTTPISDSQPIRIVPKGLRSFDAHDSDFFLELLPGPRDRDGLPDSIRFWKARIEATQADDTFSVGLIYGPSGCGKSSLVKAGLIPRLSDDVIVVYVEATAGETEKRLLNGLRRRIPALSDDLSLKDSLVTLRRGSGLPPGKTVVIILDQFEQWLHAKNEEANSELVQALRQCDGEHLRCIVMVRDDFWMAATRFMRQLEVRLLEDQNSGAVDLFDLDHAKKVLAAFGRAFGRLPENPGDTTKEQKDFLNKVVSGLATEGKVICVRLALFAEMMTGKVWSPDSLKAVGGTEGVGVTFLEETFSAATAPPEHRYHQKAARANLKALLPEAGSDIKGHMRSYAELLEASGYGNRPKDFDDLLRILDNEIRLITPTDPEGNEESSISISMGSGRYYQLTHDYLVHSLREWLTQKQKETRRGRAELLLADRAGVWNARPENRQLPSLLQWILIRWWTQKKNWSPSQKMMMAKASRLHAVRASVVGVLLAVSTFAAATIRDYVNEREQAIREQADKREKHNYAVALVGRVFDADITQVPAIIKEMRDYRVWTNPLLKEEKHTSANDPRKQLRASLALLSEDAGQVGYLYERMLNTEPNDLIVIREALLGHMADLTERLWTLLEDSNADPNQRFRAACALSLYSPGDPRWEKVSGNTAALLVIQKPFVIAQWTDALKRTGYWLIPPLTEILVDENRSISDRGIIATVYGRFADDIPDAYARLEKKLAEKAGPDATVEAKVALARKQANFGVALMIMERSEKVWPLLKHSPDPTLRSYLIDRFAPAGVDPKVLYSRFEEEQEVSVKRAILLSLGEYGFDRGLPALRQLQLPRLMQLYENDPDPGIHSTSEWILRKWHVILPELPFVEPVRSEEQKVRIATLTAKVADIRQRIVMSKQELFAAWERHLREPAAALSQSLSKGLVAHYPLDETQETETANAVSGQPAATYQGTGRLVWVDGIIGRSLKLDGTGTVVGGNPLDLEGDQSFSYGCWFQYNSQIPMILLSSREQTKGFRGFDLSLENNHQLRVEIAGEDPNLPDDRRQTFSPSLISVITTTSVDPKRNPVWHHVMVTYDGSKKANGVRIFVDGRQQPTTILNDAFQGTIKSQSGLYIGSRQWPNYRFRGQIDDVRIYNRRLSDNDVQELYESGLRALASVPTENRSPEQQAVLVAAHPSPDEPLNQLESQLATAETELSNACWEEVRRWYINTQGQTLAMVPSGRVFMGEGIGRHEVLIDRSFAIATKEVTVDQFLRFRKEHHFMKEYSPPRDYPANMVSWFDATAYCNWLSEQEGIPKDQWCYEPNKDGKYETGMTMPSDFLQRIGYRLPTESEWEYACRAGSDTGRSFGDSEELLGKYCWFVNNSLSWSHPVGLLASNDLGLFDMHGNIWEWCQDVWSANKDEQANLTLEKQDRRVLRGGSFFSLSLDVRSASRNADHPVNRSDVIGFRLARTLPPVSVTSLPSLCGLSLH